MTFIYIILFLCFYIVFGIMTFGIGYKYDFFDIRTDYNRDKLQDTENEIIFLTIFLWPFLLVIFLLFCVPKTIINNLINNIDKDLKLETKQKNKSIHDNIHL